MELIVPLLMRQIIRSIVSTALMVASMLLLLASNIVWYKVGKLRAELERAKIELTWMKEQKSWNK